MSDTPQIQPQNSPTNQPDWDKHNKRAEKAAEVFQKHIIAEGQPSPKRPKKSGGKRRWLVVLGVMVILIGVAAAAYIFMSGSSQDNDDAPSVTDAVEKPEAELGSSFNTSNMKEYSAAQMGLSLKYPSSWVVDEAAGEVLFRSPAAALPGMKPGVKGKVEVTIRAKGQPLPEFEKGNATSTRQSELLKYVNPTQSQRANTHLTFVAHAPETNGMKAMYITGDNGYQKDQAVPQIDVANMDPIITVTFMVCSDQSCTSNSPTSLESSAWDDKDFSSTIRAILQSITIQ